MVKVVWSELALADLKAIHEYISIDSRTYAGRVIRRLVGRVNQLERFPQSGRIVPEFDDVTIRELIEGNYRIVYKVDIDGVSIARIHHSARLLE